MATHTTASDNAIDIAPAIGTIDGKSRASITSGPATSLKNDATAPPAGSKRWFHWHEPGTSKEEKKLIFKLDWFLLSYACLMFFIKQVSAVMIAWSTPYGTNVAHSLMEITFPMLTYLAWQMSLVLALATSSLG